MITGIDNIRQLFSVFHDGGIEAPQCQDGTLTFNVETSYLAERIDPAFTAFSVTLRNVENLICTVWLKDQTTRTADPLTVLSEEPEILNGSLKDGAIEVMFEGARWLPTDYTGGVLSFSCASASVLAEGGRECTLDELWDLSEGYWTEWSARAKEARSSS